jgi:enamine deaminase RidA (YjgF/YER057c/UK114 family)
MIGLLKRVLDDEITAADLADALRQHAGDASSDDIEHVANVVEQFIRGAPRRACLGVGAVEGSAQLDDAYLVHAFVAG